MEGVARRVRRRAGEHHHLAAGRGDADVGAHRGTDPGERGEQTGVGVGREQHRERELDGPGQAGAHHDQLEVGALAAPGHRAGHPAHGAVEVGRRVQHDADLAYVAGPVLGGRPVDEVPLEHGRGPSGVVVGGVRGPVEQHPGHQPQRCLRGQLDQEVQRLGPAELLVEAAHLLHQVAPGDQRGQVDVVVREQVVAAAVDRPVPVAVRTGHPHRGVQHRGAVGLEVAEHHAQEVGVPGVARVDERDVRAARLARGPRCGPAPDRPAARPPAPRAARTRRPRPARRRCRRPSRRRPRRAPTRRTSGPGPRRRRRAAVARRRAPPGPR